MLAIQHVFNLSKKCIQNMLIWFCAEFWRHLSITILPCLLFGCKFVNIIYENIFKVQPFILHEVALERGTSWSDVCFQKRSPAKPRELQWVGRWKNRHAWLIINGMGRSEVSVSHSSNVNTWGFYITWPTVLLRQLVARRLQTCQQSKGKRLCGSHNIPYYVF